MFSVDAVLALVFPAIDLPAIQIVIRLGIAIVIHLLVARRQNIVSQVVAVIIPVAVGLTKGDGDIIGASFPIAAQAPIDQFSTG